MALTVGDTAPDFTLTSHRMEQVSLADARADGPVVISFFPLAFSGVCTKQFTDLGADVESYRAAGAQVLAISVDHAHSLQAFAEAVGADADGVTFLSDFQPRGEVAAAYGTLIAERGFSGRATIVVDRDGVVQHADYSPTPLEIPDVDAVKGAIAACGRD